MKEKRNKVEAAVLSLGSNLGKRECNVLEAAGYLAAAGGISLQALSSLYETEPVDGDYSGTFINAAAVFRTSLSPARFQRVCRDIEREIGGSEQSRGHDRAADIDIILFGSRVINSEELTVPHPRFRERAFVLVPLMEIYPDGLIPPGGEKISEIPIRHQQSGWTRKVSSRCSLPAR